MMKREHAFRFGVRSQITSRPPPPPPDDGSMFLRSRLFNCPMNIAAISIAVLLEFHNK